MDHFVGYWLRDIPYVWKEGKTIQTSGRTYLFSTTIFNVSPTALGKLVKGCGYPERYFQYTTDDSYINKELRVNGDALTKHRGIFSIDSLYQYLWIESKVVWSDLIVRSIRTESPFSPVRGKDIPLDITTYNTTTTDIISSYIIWKAAQEKGQCIVLGSVPTEEIAFRRYRSIIEWTIIVENDTTPAGSRGTIAQKVNMFHDKERTLRFHSCMADTKVTWIIVPITIYHRIALWNHANILFINKKDKEIILFDPWGEGRFKDTSLIRDIMQGLNAPVDVYKWKIIEQEQWCPRFAFQTMEEILTTVSSLDIEGYCKVWSLWMIEMRMKFPDMPWKELVSRALRGIQQRGTFISFIREYAGNLQAIAKDVSGKLEEFVQQMIAYVTKSIIIPKIDTQKLVFYRLGAKVVFIARKDDTHLTVDEYTWASGGFTTPYIPSLRGVVVASVVGVIIRSFSDMMNRKIPPYTGSFTVAKNAQGTRYLLERPVSEEEKSLQLVFLNLSITQGRLLLNKVYPNAKIR